MAQMNADVCQDCRSPVVGVFRCDDCFRVIVGDALPPPDVLRRTRRGEIPVPYWFDLDTDK